MEASKKTHANKKLHTFEGIKSLESFYFEWGMKKACSMERVTEMTVYIENDLHVSQCYNDEDGNEQSKYQIDFSFLWLARRERNGRFAIFEC